MLTADLTQPPIQVLNFVLKQNNADIINFVFKQFNSIETNHILDCHNLQYKIKSWFLNFTLKIAGEKKKLKQN